MPKKFSLSISMNTFRKATAILAIILILAFLFYMIFSVNLGKYTLHFSNFNSFIVWLKQEGYSAKIIKKLPDHSRNIYQASDGRMLSVNKKIWNCYLFTNKKNWENMEANQKKIFRAFAPFIKKDDYPSKILTFYNIRCFE